MIELTRGEIITFAAAISTMALGLVLIVLTSIRMNRKLFLFSGLFALCVGPYSILQTQLSVSLGVGTAFVEPMKHIILFLAALFLAAFMRNVLTQKTSLWLMRSVEISITFLALCSALSVVGTVSNWFPSGISLTAFRGCAPIVGLLCVASLTQEVIRGNADARPLLLGSVFSILLWGLDVLTSILGMPDALKGQSVPVGFLFLIFSVFLMLTNRITNLYHRENQMHTMLDRVLSGAYELGTLHNKYTIAHRAVSTILDELSCGNGTQALVHFFTDPTPLTWKYNRQLSETNYLRDGSIEYGKIQSIKELTLEGSSLYIPVRADDKNLAVVQITCSHKKALTESATKAIPLVSENFSMSLRNSLYLDMQKEAAKRERKLLRERISMAVDLSDRLNSPLLVAINVSLFLDKNLQKLQDRLKEMCRDSEAEKLMSDTLTRFAHMKEAVDSINRLSLQLSRLRDNDKTHDNSEDTSTVSKSRQSRHQKVRR